MQARARNQCTFLTQVLSAGKSAGYWQVSKEAHETSTHLDHQQQHHLCHCHWHDHRLRLALARLHHQHQQGQQQQKQRGLHPAWQVWLLCCLAGPLSSSKHPDLSCHMFPSLDVHGSHPLLHLASGLLPPLLGLPVLLQH
jgi:hypothetical protein